MNFTDRFSEAPIRDEQMTTVIEEVERLTPEPRRVGQIGAEADGPQSIMWQDWYETSRGGIISVGRSFITMATDKTGTAPTTLESWAVQLDPRRGKQVGEFVISNAVKLEIKIMNLSEEAKAREAKVARGRELMGKIGLQSSSERELHTNPGKRSIAYPDQFHGLVSVTPRIYDKGGYLVDNNHIADLGLKAAEALKNHQSDAYPLLDKFNAESARDNTMRGRMKETASRKVAFQAIRAMQQLDPDNRLQRTPFARPSS